MELFKPQAPSSWETHLQYWKWGQCHICFHTAASMEDEQFLDSHQTPAQCRRDIARSASVVQGHTEQNTKPRDREKQNTDLNNVQELQKTLSVQTSHILAFTAHLGEVYDQVILRRNWFGNSRTMLFPQKMGTKWFTEDNRWRFLGLLLQQFQAVLVNSNRSTISKSS